MNENNNTTNTPITNCFIGLSSNDKCFVVLIGAMILVYGLKRYFDSTDKAIEHGYNTTVKSPKYGEIKFEYPHNTVNKDV